MRCRWIAGALVAAALAAASHPVNALRQPVALWEEVYVRVRPGATVQARFHVSVETGYFVVAGNAPESGPLRALKLRMNPVADVQVGQPAYPAPTANAELAGLPPFPAYEGVIAVSVPVTAPAKAQWKTRRLEGVLEYQACTADGCRPPDTLPVAIELELRPADA